MHAHRETHGIPERCDSRGASGLIRIAGGKDRERLSDASATRPVDHGVQIRVEDAIGKVTMGVDH
jgi:hypothetical protein